MSVSSRYLYLHQDKKFLTGDEVSVADAMTALELWPILRWAATGPHERLREWREAVFRLEAVKESGIEALDARPPLKSGQKNRRAKAPSSSKVQVNDLTKWT